MERDLTLLDKLLVDCEAGRATQITLLRALVEQVRALGSDLSDLTDDYRKEYLENHSPTAARDKFDCGCGQEWMDEREGGGATTVSVEPVKAEVTD